jgi:DNA-binding transcriptional regulator YiaG
MPRKPKIPQPKYHANQLLQYHPNTSARQFARLFNVHPGTIERWRNPKTMLNQWEADRYAIMIGKHPSEIWADWFDIPC